MTTYRWDFSGAQGLATGAILPLTLSILALILPFSSPAATSDCNTLPPPDPTKNFIQNFLHPCYFVAIPTGTGDGVMAGDLNASYNRIFYNVNPQYELIVVGEFPQARYLSISSYDDHLAAVNSVTDYQIAPLSRDYTNPFRPGKTFVEDQLYAIAMQFGGTEPRVLAPGCGLQGIHIHANLFNLALRHPGISWNWVTDLPVGIPSHDDIGPSHGGEITVRRYFQGADNGNVKFAAPVILVRDLRTGCAVPASEVLLQANEVGTSATILTYSNSIAKQWSWLNQTEFVGHEWYMRTYETKRCSPPDPSNHIAWFRGPLYIPAGNSEEGYVLGNIGPSQLAWLLSTRGFMRFRFSMPLLPNLPCSGCTLTGAEQLRYWSLTFATANAKSLATISDDSIVVDPNGYATIIAGFGTQPPTYVNAAHYYTYIDLSQVPDIADFTTMTIRTLLPGGGFLCGGQAVPYDTMEYNPLGGYMGGYIPEVDFLTANAIPPVPAELPGVNSCALTPEPPAACTPRGAVLTR